MGRWLMGHSPGGLSSASRALISILVPQFGGGGARSTSTRDVHSRSL